MSTATAPPPPAVPPTALPATHTFPKFHNGEEWLHSLGDVPLSRVIFDPWPGTATEDDLLRLVEGGDRLCELIDGTLVEKAVGAQEAWIGGVIVTRLNVYVMPRNLGVVLPADATLRMHNRHVRLPDVSFVSIARWEKLPRPIPAIPSIGPDLVVEVLSKSNRKREIDMKLKECFASGTRLAWIVDPVKRTVAVYLNPDAPDRVLTEADELDGGDVLPGFTLQIRELFESPF